MPMRKTTRRRVGLLAAFTALSAAVVTAPAAFADTTNPSAAPVPSVQLKPFASAPAGAKGLDDITLLGDLLFATYQNDAGPDGSPAGSRSTVVAFDRKTGAVKQTYTIPGKVDGLTADTKHHRVLASANEDLNSSLYVITPDRDHDGHGTITHYTYSPSPAETGTDGTNGGTDAISIGSNGTVYVAHSNPDTSLPGADNTAAVYTLKLSGSTARLTPLFGVNDTVPVINPAAGQPTSAPLGLTDPDSNRFLRGKDGGTLVQDAQADSKLVFVTDLDAKKPTVKQLNLTNAVTPSQGAATPQLDDVERVDGPGTLFVADGGTGTIYRADTGDVPAGTLFASQPAPKAGDLPNDPALAVVNTRTGVVTHVSAGVTLVNPKGLLFVPGDKD
ncbi:hypothetical protein P3T35_000008 [Kitasatospora sp. GP30]|uniref:hypothetical protein n=1 Tax=Kitasatospora sp. GP30 TaxID=3035084 RepID=UPI000C70AEAD|nr:hypothetical protein [Kitasatospora sp. GP30]MDH6138031.1 hypothetical protein [Kitasatospora sp. GP30]